MWTLIVTFLAVLIVVAVLVALASGATKKRTTLAHERLDKDYTYRKEPHADQVTERPNRLRDNPVTDVAPEKKEGN